MFKHFRLKLNDAEWEFKSYQYNFVKGLAKRSQAFTGNEQYNNSSLY